MSVTRANGRRRVVVEYKGTMEVLGNLWRRLDSLAGLVEKNSRRVLGKQLGCERIYEYDRKTCAQKYHCQVGRTLSHTQYFRCRVQLRPPLYFLATLNGLRWDPQLKRTNELLATGILVLPPVE